MDQERSLEIATFSTGCFWDVEAAFRHTDGVVSTTAGYTGGTIPEPTYEQVSSGTTGHVEAVRVIFDPAEITYDQLLEIFWSIIPHAPATPCGSASGIQGRPVIFYHSDEQKKNAELSRQNQVGTGTSGDAAEVTAIVPATAFFPAEECHQQFYEKSACSYSSTPKYWE
jgi:methionine-S-sulfoxide reductase